MGRVTYIPDDEKFWAEYFLSQAVQTGHGMNGFQGFQYQRGHGLGSFFGRLFRSILPIARNIGKSALKTIGKEALSMGASVAGDLVRGREAKDSLAEHGRNAAANVLDKASSALKGVSQTGGRLGKRSYRSRTAVAAKKQPKRKRRKVGGSDIFQE